MSNQTGRGARLYSNLIWLLVLAALIGGTVLVWRRGDNLFSPSRESAVVRVFRKSSPAVVSIKAEPLPGAGNFPTDEFFRSLFPERDSGRYNQGSGIIIDPRGFIVTNEHVVLNTSRVQVVLADGSSVDAEIWGTEPTLDLAVLKVEVGNSLPYLEMGSSDDLMIGEDVVVIGNPLGYGLTCNTGIVSALHRSVPIEERVLKDLIQIDAAVNLGNSGGPLLDIRGELVGITTALIRDAQGIGFAIPIGRVRQVVSDLIEYRYVPTGWLGMSVEDLAEAGAAFGATVNQGVFISGIELDGPAAGELKAGDVLEAWDGTTIRSLDDFVGRARGLRANQEVKFLRVRDGKAQQVRVTAAAFPEHLAEDWLWASLGVRVVENRFWVRDETGNKVIQGGVFVQKVAPGSPAAYLGLVPGDWIKALNRFKLETRVDLQRAVVQLRSHRSIYLVFRRGPTNEWRLTAPLKVSGEKW